LVQWRKPDGTCKRCGRGLDEAPEQPLEPVPEAEPAKAPPKSSPTKAIILGVVGIILVAVTVHVLTMMPVWTQKRGAEVKQFTDSLDLVRLNFPEEWHFLRLHEPDLPIPHPDTEKFRTSIRGSFYLGELEDPTAIMYFRIRSLGLGIGSERKLSSNERALVIHRRFASDMEKIGGSYESLLVTDDIGIENVGDEEPYVIQAVNRFKMFRTDGLLMTLDPIYAWRSGGVFRITIYTFTESGREYWLFGVAPEDHYAAAWPQIRRVIDAADFRHVAL
jgi:hypothetical protein